jgi:hypothetical protein
LAQLLYWALNVGRSAILSEGVMTEVQRAHLAAVCAEMNQRKLIRRGKSGSLTRRICTAISGALKLLLIFEGWNAITGVDFDPLKALTEAKESSPAQ